jgi:hypothetical protein
MNPLAAALYFIIAVFLAAAVAGFFKMILGAGRVQRELRAPVPFDAGLMLRSPLVPGVSVLVVPADGAREWRQFVARLLDLEHANCELVLVLSGRAADDLDGWVADFRLNLVTRVAAEDLPVRGVSGVYESVGTRRLVVVHKQEGGESDALNAGVNVASFPLLAVVDRDSVLTPSLLLRLCVPVLEAPESTVAVCAVGCTRPDAGLASRIGALECARHMLAGSMKFLPAQMGAAFPGRAVVFQRQAVLDTGGFRDGVLEMLVRLETIARRGGKPWRVVPVIGAVRERTPETLAVVLRRAWSDQRELGRVWRSLPSLFAARFLRPLLETTGYPLAAWAWLSGAVDFSAVGLFLIATAGAGTLQSMAAAYLHGAASLPGTEPPRLLRLFLASLPENLGYRQVQNVMLIAGFLAPRPADRPAQA